MLIEAKERIDKMGAFDFGQGVVSNTLYKADVSLKDLIAVMILCLHTGHGFNRACLVAERIVTDFENSINKAALEPEGLSFNDLVRSLVFKASNEEEFMSKQIKGYQVYATEAIFSATVERYYKRYIKQ